MVLLLDSKLQPLPLESLKVFKSVPVVARDFNLHIYMQRLKTLGHVAELHNNKGVAKEELSYIVDPPKSLEAEAKRLVDEGLPAMSSASQWKGILTSTEHSPSIGEWQERISKSSMFAYFSMTCLLHKFHPSMVADLSIFSKCRAMIIFDRMNTYKTLIDRNVVTSPHFVPSEQPMQEAVLFSLCGVQTVVTNHWATKPENNLELFDALLRGSLTDGLYLGASAKRHWAQLDQQLGDLDAEDQEARRLKDSAVPLFRHNTCTYGVPLVRVI